MTIALARRMARLPPQFFAELVTRAGERASAGHHVINLGQGNPVDPTPPSIVAALQAGAADPQFHRYGPFGGLTRLKVSGAAWWQRRYGVSLDPEREVAVVIGVKVVLTELALMMVNPGDAVLVPDPGYPDYYSGIALAGGVALPYRLTAASGFAPNFTEMPPARLLYLNYPHNPTGALAPPGLASDAVDWAHRAGALIVHDLAYGDITFDGQRASSLLATAGAKSVSLELLSLSKTFNMAGWRIGLAAGSADAVAALATLQDHLHCSQFGGIQLAASYALDNAEVFAARTAAVYQRRRDLFISEVARAKVTIPKPAGGIFLWWPVPGHGSGEAFAQFLLNEADVLVAPGIGFGEAGRSYVRVSLTATEDDLRAAGARIRDVLPRWS